MSKLDNRTVKHKIHYNSLFNAITNNGRHTIMPHNIYQLLRWVITLNDSAQQYPSRGCAFFLLLHCTSPHTSFTAFANHPKVRTPQPSIAPREGGLQHLHLHQAGSRTCLSAYKWSINRTPTPHRIKQNPTALWQGSCNTPDTPLSCSARRHRSCGRSAEPAKIDKSWACAGRPLVPVCPCVLFVRKVWPIVFLHL